MYAFIEEKVEKGAVKSFYKTLNSIIAIYCD